MPNIVKYLYPTIGLIVIQLICASQTFACRIMRLPQDKVALGGFDAVVVGQVTHARYTGEKKSHYHPWEGAVSVRTVIRGDVKQDTFPIYRSGSRVACDDGEPVPPEGQPWVLYLRGQGSILYVVNSFPLTIACGADPALPKAVCEGLPRSNVEK
jgi:hypothetical protein